MRPIARVVSSLCLLGALTLANAQNLSYTTIVRAWVDWTSDEHYVQDDPGLQTASVSLPTGNALARAQIAPGVNSAYAHWDSLDPNQPSERLIADAQTYWTDTVLIDDPELNGTVGTFTASLRVFGSSSFGLSGIYSSGDPYSDAYIYGFWDTWIGTSTDGGGSFLVGGWFGDWYSDEFGEIWYSGDELNQEMTPVTLEFIYGQPFLLRTNLESYFDATNSNLLPGTVEGTLDFSHTSYWNGIGGFYDAQGNLTHPNFWSQSGVDWRNAAVPEPATATVGLTGLALVVIGTWMRGSRGGR